MTGKKDIATIFADAFERLQLGIFGVQDFKVGGETWRVVVEPGHMEARKVGPGVREEEKS